MITFFFGHIASWLKFCLLSTLWASLRCSRVLRRSYYPNIGFIGNFQAQNLKNGGGFQFTFFFRLSIWNWALVRILFWIDFDLLNTFTCLLSSLSTYIFPQGFETAPLLQCWINFVGYFKVKFLKIWCFNKISLIWHKFYFRNIFILEGFVWERSFLDKKNPTWFMPKWTSQDVFWIFTVSLYSCLCFFKVNTICGEWGMCIWLWKSKKRCHCMVKLGGGVVYWN